MYKASAVAHANLAFVKYWGKLDSSLNIPANGSISMNLSNAKTVTDVHFGNDLKCDVVTVNNMPASRSSAFYARVKEHLDRIRSLAEVDLFAEVNTRNSFPTSAGFASSASGFAALTLAGATAVGLKLTEKQMSILARQGSGSACRSIPSGFVEWIAGHSSATSYAIQIAPPSHWEIVDVAVVVSSKPKAVSSSQGHELALQSPFWNARQQNLEERLHRVRKAIIDQDFETFGKEIEAEALSLHVIALTSSHMSHGHWKSGLYYWTPDTLELLVATQQWRSNGLDVYYTLDAGSTVHLICEQRNQEEVLRAVNSLIMDREWSVIVNSPASGAYISDSLEANDSECKQ